MQMKDASGSEPARHSGIMETRADEGAAMACAHPAGSETGGRTSLPATPRALAFAVEEKGEDFLLEVDG